MKTSIIILTYNKLEYTVQCIDSIRKYTENNTYEIIVIDNASTDGTVDWLKQQKDIKTIFNQVNAGFPAGCNQGIKISSFENILFLNNDVVVTENWLNNLVTCLYSSENIGAVGPITNSASYYSTIPINYTNIEDMHIFATKKNISNHKKWEERLKLIGYCFLVKREVVNQIGQLDEIFSPGNFEDDDFSVRIRQKGYKLMICKDTFIHHYGSTSWKDDLSSFSRILSDNEVKFKKKWGTDSSSYLINEELIELINFPKDSKINILHIGCKAGATLLDIKNRFRNSNLYGVEKNDAELKEAKTVGNIYKNIEEIKNIKFDVILFSDEKILLTKKIANHLLLLLKENGIFLGKYRNISYHKIVKKIILGNYEKSKQTNLYSLNQLNKMFDQTNFKSTISGLNGPSEDENKFSNTLEKVYKDSSEELLKFKFLILKGEIRNKKLVSLINQINVKENVQDELFELKNYSLNEILELIESTFDDPVKLLQKIAINYFNFENNEFVIPYLQKAYELDSINSDTLFNMAFVLTSYGEYKLANRYIEMIIEKDDVSIQLGNFINNKLKVYEQKNENLVPNNYLESSNNDPIEQNDVKFTGERIVINKEVKEGFKNIMEEHLARYRFASQFVKDKVVLDAACGTGYGVKLLQLSGSKSVVGVDISVDSLENAKKTYFAENVEYKYGDVNKLNIEERSFDVVVSFETIEHIKNGMNWIEESARVLKDNGLFIVSTPNRTITNPGAYFKEKPLNQFHEFEYNINEFVGELLKKYDIIDLYGQSIIPDYNLYSSRIMREIRSINTNNLSTNYIDYPEYELLPLSELKDATPTYIVALCRKK